MRKLFKQTKAVIYYTKFRESQWWRISLKLATNKFKPACIGKALITKSPITALLDSQHRGNTWMQLTAFSYGIAVGILHQSYNYPKDSVPLYYLGDS